MRMSPNELMDIARRAKVIAADIERETALARAKAALTKAGVPEQFWRYG